MNYSFDPSKFFYYGIPQLPNDQNPIAITLYRLWSHDKLPVNEGRDIAYKEAEALGLPKELGEHLFWYQLATLAEKDVPSVILSDYRQCMNSWLHWIAEEFQPYISENENIGEVADLLMLKIDNELSAL